MFLSKKKTYKKDVIEELNNLNSRMRFIYKKHQSDPLFYEKKTDSLSDIVNRNLIIRNLSISISLNNNSKHMADYLKYYCIAGIKVDNEVYDSKMHEITNTTTHLEFEEIPVEIDHHKAENLEISIYYTKIDSVLQTKGLIEAMKTIEFELFCDAKIKVQHLKLSESPLFIFNYSVNITQNSPFKTYKSYTESPHLYESVYGSLIVSYKPKLDKIDVIFNENFYIIYRDDRLQDTISNRKYKTAIFLGSVLKLTNSDNILVENFCYELFLIHTTFITSEENLILLDESSGDRIICNFKNETQKTKFIDIFSQLKESAQTWGNKVISICDYNSTKAVLENGLSKKGDIMQILSDFMSS